MAASSEPWRIKQMSRAMSWLRSFLSIYLLFVMKSDDLIILTLTVVVQWYGGFYAENVNL